VTIVATLGHTRGQVSGVLEDGPQSVFFACDTCYTEAVIRGQARQQPLVYLLLHDPGAVTRLVAMQIVGGTPSVE
jgi:hypothetical protein